MYANKINGLNYKSYGNLGGSGLTNRPNPSNLGLNSSMSNGARVQKTGWFSDLKPKSDANRAGEQCPHGVQEIRTKKEHEVSGNSLFPTVKRRNEVSVICRPAPSTKSAARSNTKTNTKIV